MPGLEYNAISLPNGRDWIWRPVLSPNMNVRPVELYDGTYDLCQIAEMNDVLDAEAENQYRAQEAMSKKNAQR